MLLIVFTVVIQIALIALAACAFNRLLQSHSAATRHGIWGLAMIAIAITVPCKWIVPSVSVVVEATEQQITSTDTSSQVHAVPAEDTELAWHEPFELLRPDAMAFTPQAKANTHPSQLPGLPKHSIRTMHSKFSGWQIAGCCYLIGVLVFVLRLSWSAGRLHALTRGGFSLPNSLKNEACKIAESLTLGSAPRIRVCQKVKTPMVYGVWRSTILLPESFCDLSGDCQRSVLTHEMAHVARQDGRWELVSQLIRCVYWFHPAVHMVAKAQRTERELATDEAVIDAGISPIDYARHLIDVLNRKRTSPLAIAMSHFGDMESRLQLILDPETGRKSSTPLIVAMCLFSAFAMGSVNLVAQKPLTEGPEEDQTSIPTKPTQPGLQSEIPATIEIKATPTTKKPNREILLLKHPAAQPPQIPPAVKIESEPKNAYEAITKANLVSKDRHAKLKYNLSGRVIDQNGLPVANAAVALRLSDSAGYSVEDSMKRQRLRPDVLARSTTDADGRYDFRSIAAVASPLLHYEPWCVCAATQDGDYGWSTLSFDRNKNTLTGSGDIRVAPPTTISGSWVSPTGEPIQGKAILRAYYAPGFFDGTRVDSAKVHAPILTTLNAPVELDPKGRFQFSNVPTGVNVGVELFHSDWCRSFARIATSDTIPLGPQSTTRAPTFWLPSVTRSGTKLTAEKGVHMKGIVVDEQGTPIPGCHIQANCPYRIVTDEQGRYSDRISEERFRHYGAGDPSPSISFMLYNQEYLSQRVRVRRSAMVEGEPLRTVMKRGTPIVGMVQTESGEPVTDMIIRAHPIQQNISSERVRAARTNADGSFKMKVGDGHYELRIPLPNAPKAEPVSVGKIKASAQEFELTKKPIDLATITLPAGEPVPIRCIDETGKPVPQAKVMLFHKFGSAKSYPQVAGSGITDSEGNYSLRVPVVYSSNLVVHADLESDSLHLWGEMNLPPNPINKTTTVVMRKKWRICGKVTVNSKPMKDVSIMVWRNAPGIRYSGSHSMSGQGRAVNDDGTYEWFVPPNGSYCVQFWGMRIDSRRGSGRRYAVQQVAPDEFLAEEIKLVYAEGKIAGRVITRDGSPVERIQVSAMPRHGNRALLANPSQNTGKAQTDKNGSFTIEGLPDGEYRLSAYSITRPKSHYGTSTNATVGQRDVKIIMKPID